jgi:hypothetical protein
VNGFRSIDFSLDLKDSVGRRLYPDAVVVQEDRNLVMSSPSVLDLDQDDDLDSAYLAITQHRPLRLGRYLLRRPAPESLHWTYQAVVHDLERSPSSRGGDVRRSLVAIVKDAQKRGLMSLAVEPLGMWERLGLDFEEMMQAFEEAIMDLVSRQVSSLRLTLLLDSLADIEEVSHLARLGVLRRASRRFRTVAGDEAVAEIRHHDTRICFRFVPGSMSGYQVIRRASSYEY